MELKELLSFIETEDQRLATHYGPMDQEKRTLARTVKLSKEMGELCEQILAHNNLQRKSKLDSIEKEKLPEEFADVIITTLLVAKSMNIDIVSALKEKTDKINKRYDHQKAL